MFDLFGRKKALRARMLKGVGLIQTGLYKRLKNKYMSEYDDRFSGRLAAAVINELLFGLPGREDARIFVEENKALIDVKLQELKSDEEIKYAVTQALRVIALCEYMVDSSKKTLEKWSENLRKALDRGVFIKGGETPTPDTFLPFATDFYNSSPKVNKDE